MSSKRRISMLVCAALVAGVPGSVATAGASADTQARPSNPGAIKKCKKIKQPAKRKACIKKAAGARG